jgi:hypothetical protein
MHIIRTTLAIAAAWLSLTTVHAAERGDSDGSAKHLSSGDRASTGRSHVDKASGNRSMHSVSARSHTSHRTSRGTRRSGDRQTTKSKHDAPRSVNDSIQPDADVQVELPSHENENASENGAEDDDQSSILFGGTENDVEQP